MNERDFRRRVRAVLGEPPGHAGAVERLEGRLADSLRSAPRAERHHPRGMPLVAGALALLTVGVLLAPQIAGRTRGPQPSPTTRPAPRDPHDCRLPVVIKAVWPPRSYLAGFVSLRSGDFAEDPSARLDKLPNSDERVDVLATYDPVARRWLPVPSTAVAPDHRSYAFVKARAGTSWPSVWELRVFELDSMGDRLVWSSPGEIGHVTWSGDGIEFATAPPSGGGFTQAWRIAPKGGGPYEIPLPPWARPIEWGGPDWLRPRCRSTTRGAAGCSLRNTARRTAA